MIATDTHPVTAPNWRTEAGAVAATADLPLDLRVDPAYAHAHDVPIRRDDAGDSGSWLRRWEVDTVARSRAFAGKVADGERRRRADPTIDVPVPTLIDVVGSAPAVVWPACGHVTHDAEPLVVERGSGFLGRLFADLTFDDPADRPVLVALWADGTAQWYAAGARLKPSDPEPFPLTVTALASGRLLLHTPAMSAARILDRWNRSAAERLGTTTPDVAGDPIALAHVIQGPAPAAVPHPLTVAESLIARAVGTGGADRPEAS